MFVVVIKYIKPIEMIDEYLIPHRAFLDTCYENNVLIASGPQNPRVGGVLLSQLKEKSQLENILKQDPFLIHDLATYEFIEFLPVKYHKNFESFIQST